MTTAEITREELALRDFIHSHYKEAGQVLGLSPLHIRQLRLHSAEFKPSQDVFLQSIVRIWYEGIASPEMYSSSEQILRNAGVIRPDATIRVTDHYAPGKGKFIEIKGGGLELTLDLLDPADPRNLPSIH